MRKQEYARFLVFMALGIALAALVFLPVHELGHYLPACCFDCSIVEEVSIPLDLDKLMHPQGNLYVKFNSSYPYGLSWWQATTILLGGYAAELSMIALALSLFLRTSNRKATSFLAGFLTVAMLIHLTSPWADIGALLVDAIGLTQGTAQTIIIAMILIETLLAVCIWYYVIVKKMHAVIVSQP